MIYNTDGIKEILISLAHTFQVRDLIDSVIQWDKFYLWSGSSQPIQHHYGKGGLATHTQEVIELCDMTAGKYKLSYDDRQKLFLAALYHDIGKIWDYKPVCEYLHVGGGNPDIEKTDYLEWEKTSHCALIHHISRSALFFNEVCPKYQFKDEVTHCILSHHGQRDWGSPVTPKTKIAWILHLCDGLSARVADNGGFHE